MDCEKDYAKLVESESVTWIGLRITCRNEFEFWMVCEMYCENVEIDKTNENWKPKMRKLIKKPVFNSGLLKWRLFL